MAGALDKLFREDGQEEDQRPEESSSDESSGSLPIGLDDEYKEEDEAIEKIMQDDTLDEPAKIDLIAEERGWFHSDTTIIDAFMAGELDAAAAAEKLAEPIDETYSTADHNRALYTEERVARTQRIYHSREKALEMVGSFRYSLWQLPGEDNQQSKALVKSRLHVLTIFLTVGSRRGHCRTESRDSRTSVYGDAAMDSLVQRLARCKAYSMD